MDRVSEFVAFNLDRWGADLIAGALMCIGWLAVSVVWDRLYHYIRKRRG